MSVQIPRLTLVGCWMTAGGVLAVLCSLAVSRPDVAIYGLLVVAVGGVLLGVGAAKQPSDVWAWVSIVVFVVIARAIVPIMPESIVAGLIFAALAWGGWSSRVGLFPRRRSRGKG